LLAANVSEPTPDRPARGRQLANQSLLTLPQQALGAPLFEIDQRERQAKGDNKDFLLTFVVQSMMQRRGMPPAARLDEIRRNIDTLEQARRKKPDQAALYDALIARLRFEYWQTHPDRPAQGFHL